MKIEKFTIELYEEIVLLWRKAGISVGSSDTREELERVLQRNPNLFLIGKKLNKVIGVVIGGFDGRRGYVHHLAVDPDYQKKGYGKMIMDELIEKFRKIGVHKIHLFIEKYNKNAVEFYRHLGWDIRDDLIMMSYVPDKNLYKMRI
ncbi:MAG: GNAT family N-acetyltransferase [Candidatus Lokiarchaeota archaeon]|nr:GNAT family N-acetyltransferase [Candidatus Lokiarchaeota archaeon]